MNDSCPPTTCVDAEPYALRVTDDSMAPEFPAGCVVVVDPAGHAREGAFVVAETAADGLVLGRLRMEDGRIRLEPLAPGHPVWPLPGGFGAVRGVVVQRAGRRRRDRRHYT